jgi:hypothetical protein
MNWKTFSLFLGCVVGISSFGLALSNPTLSLFRDAVLTTRAAEEADRISAADRHAIEREAARLASEFASVNHDPARLDASMIRTNHPLLGAALAHQNPSDGRTLTENLSRSKDHALRRVAAMHETLRSGILVELDAHTTRSSYGLWSVYSICLEKWAFSYTGIAGHFYPRTLSDCPQSPR